MMSKALLVIDVQEGWRNPSSPLYLGSDFKDLTKNIQELVQFCRSKSISVVWVTHVLKADGSDRERFQPPEISFFVEGTKDVQLMSELQPLPSETVLKKNRLSCFLGTNLQELLKRENMDELVLCGIMTNGCVRTTAIDAYQRNLKVVVVKDCCASGDSEVDEFTFKDLKNLLFGFECPPLEDFKKQA